jgi:aldehyde:ferredoxin oxidoreductase
MTGDASPGVRRLLVVRIEVAMNGYINRILYVDLDGGRIWDEPLNVEYARQFVGGSGLAARYLADMVGPDTEPLGPENPLIFMTGPFVGTQVPAAGRYEVVARSPLTGFTGESNSGGFFGPALRQAGYDGIVITGRASRPVYLALIDGEPPQIRPADHLWGLDTYETQRQVQSELAQPKARVACIGQAGEHLVRYAAIMNDAGRAAGRTGMGAVMGSKNLKAIAAFGRRKVPIADEPAFKEALKQTFNTVLEDVSTQMLRLGGSLFYAEVGNMYGDVSAKYYSQGAMPEAEDTINAGHMIDTIFDRAGACFRCPIMCNREVHLDGYSEPKVDGPEYETAIGFGPQMGSADRRSGVRDRYRLWPADGFCRSRRGDVRRPSMQHLRFGYYQHFVYN